MYFLVNHESLQGSKSKSQNILAECTCAASPRTSLVGSLTRGTDVALLRLRSVAVGRVLSPTAEPGRHGCVWKTPRL